MDKGQWVRPLDISHRPLPEQWLFPLRRGRLRLHRGRPIKTYWDELNPQ